jgi:hypothetical protein
LKAGGTSLVIGTFLNIQSENKRPFVINRIEPTFVIVGAGGISRSYAQAFVQGLPYKLVGVADIRMESATDVAAMAGVPAYDNVDTMIRELKPTAAIVCTRRRLIQTFAFG